MNIPVFARRNKYGNKKTEMDGITFDSKREAKRYAELNLLQRGKVISDLQLQVEFQLIEPMRIAGKHYRAIIYRADFVYMQDGKQVVEDAKGVRTDVFQIKKRLMKQVHGIDVVLV